MPAERRLTRGRSSHASPPRRRRRRRARRDRPPRRDRPLASGRRVRRRDRRRPGIGLGVGDPADDALGARGCRVLRERLELRTWAAGIAAGTAARRTSIAGDARRRGRGGGRSGSTSTPRPAGRPASAPTSSTSTPPSAAGARPRTKLSQPACARPRAPSEREWRFEAADVDLAGHVNNAVYWRVLEELVPAAPARRGRARGRVPRRDRSGDGARRATPRTSSGSSGPRARPPPRSRGGPAGRNAPKATTRRGSRPLLRGCWHPSGLYPAFQPRKHCPDGICPWRGQTWTTTPQRDFGVQFRRSRPRPPGGARARSG